MKKVMLILSSLLFTHSAYADCSVKQAIQNYDIGTIEINNLPFNYELPTYVSHQIVAGCSNNGSNPNISTNFIPNSTALSSTSPFQILKKEEIELSTAASSSSIDQAKEYIIRNLRLSFSLQDNTNGGRRIDILNSSENYNIIPNSVPNLANVITYNGIRFYQGAEGAGINSLGIRIPTLTAEFSSEQPTSSIINVLNNSIVRIKIGDFKTQYYYPSSTTLNPIISHDSPAYLQMAFSTKPPTCSVNVPNTLDLGSTTAVLIQNGPQNRKNFNINIQCNTVMDDNHFKLKILDANNISNVNTTGLLANSANELTKSSAVIQLINNINGQPFKIGEFFDYFSEQGNNSQFQKVASAQLLNISDQVTHGYVEGKATFFVEYN